MARRSTWLWLLAISLVASSGLWAEESVPKPLEPRDDVPGVKNFAEVSPQLWRGAQPTSDGFAELKRKGVKTVVNLRSLHSDRDELAGTGLQYIHISCQAWEPEEEDILKFLKVLAEKDNHPVFVHCQAGADRTGCMVAAYRIVEQGWTADQAIAEMRKFRFHEVFDKNLSFTRQLDRDQVAKKLADLEQPKCDIVK